MSKQAGFTLIELVITLAVLAIVLGVAVPSFTTLYQRNQLTSEANQLLTALTMARTQAIMRNSRVTVCKSNQATTGAGMAASPSCAGAGDWSQGFVVFVDGGTVGTVDGGDEVLQQFEQMPGNMTAVGNDPLADYVSYERNGLGRNGNGAFLAGTINLCYNGKGRQLVLSSSGRSRVQLPDNAAGGGDASYCGSS